MSTTTFNLEIPDKAFEQHAIALGKTRSGKSSAMRLIVERHLDAGRRVCIIDPKGDWHGIRASSTGKSAGYPVVIFGGEHADVPLNQAAGAHVAELIATGNRPCIIDLGGWHVAERTRFFIDFASTLFRLSKAPMQLVIDEVHNFAPQGKILDPLAGQMIHWSNRLASEGQGKGIILLAASQRPQKVTKDFVTSCETLMAFRVIHPLDRGAIKEWIDGCPDRDKGAEVLSSLATMPRGEAWVWSPEIGFGPKRVKFPRFSTFDSFAAPTAGADGAAKLKGWAEVDLEAVRDKLQSVVEEAKANDPRELKRRIAELERQAKTAGAAKPQIQRVEVPIITDAQVKRVESVADRLEAEGKRRIASAEKLAESGRELVATAREFAAALGRAKAPAVPAVVRPTTTTRPPLAGFAKGTFGERLPDGERKVVTVAAQYPDGVDREQISILAGYKRSTRDAYIQRAAGRGYVEIAGDRIIITEAGTAALGTDFEPLPTGDALREYWLNRLPEGERKVFEVVTEAYPEAMDREAIGELTGYKRSTRDAYIQRLGTRKLIQARSDGVRASDTLFEATTIGAP